MDKVNNVGSASQVGSSLSPIETAILILIGAFILMRITKKFLNRINRRPPSISFENVRESSSSTSTGSTDEAENEGKIKFSNKTQHTRQLLTKYYS
ncbi:MAG: hypothetical protein MHMPM18_004591 [Marteilia pararefringens]